MRGACVLLSLAALLQCSAQVQEPLLGPEPGSIAKGLLSDDFSRFVEHVNDKWAVQVGMPPLRSVQFPTWP